MSATLYYAFTLNNYTPLQEKVIQDFARTYCSRLMYGREEAPTTGTKHLQGCFQLNTKKEPKTVKNLLALEEIHLESQKKVYVANANYCEKSENCWYFPNKQANFDQQGRPITKKSAKFEEALKLARQGRFEEISAEMILKHEPRLIKQYVEHLPMENLMLDNEHGNFFKDFFILLHGPTGVGKSHVVEIFVYILNRFWKLYCQKKGMLYQALEVYCKKCNKWWDGYRGQKVVVIEELEPNWFRLSGNMMKQLLDQYPFPVECKGATINKIRPWFVIMTSNYSLRQLCSKEDGTVIEENYKPLSRRIFCYNKLSRNEFINWPNLDRLYTYFDTHEEVLRNKMFEKDRNFNKCYELCVKFNEEKESVEVNTDQEEIDQIMLETSLKEQGIEPNAEITDEEPENEPILLDTVENEISSGSETEEDVQEEEYDWVSAAKEPEMCWYCEHKVSNHCTCGRRNEDGSEKVIKDTEYFDNLIESAARVQEFNKQLSKHNEKVYQVNYVQFEWETPSDMTIINYYRNIIRGFNTNAFRARRRITDYQRKIARLEDKKLNLDEGYKFIDGMNIGDNEVFKNYKEKADCLSDLMISLSNCSEMIDKYYEEIQQEMQNVMWNFHQMNKYKQRLELFIVSKNKELRKLVSEITEVYFGNNDD